MLPQSDVSVSRRSIFLLVTFFSSSILFALFWPLIRLHVLCLMSLVQRAMPCFVPTSRRNASAGMALSSLRQGGARSGPAVRVTATGDRRADADGAGDGTGVGNGEGERAGGDGPTHLYVLLHGLGGTGDDLV